MVIEYKLVIMIGFHFRPVDILYFVKKQCSIHLTEFKDG